MSTVEYPKDHSFWNPIFILFFVLLIAAAFWLTYGNSYAMSQLYNFDLFDVLILGLATLRLIRLVTFDKIVQFFRNFFLNKSNGEYVKPEAGFKRAIVELYECIWCTGMWGALVALFLYVSSPLGFFVTLVLAISALGSVFQNLSKLIARFSDK